MLILVPVLVLVYPRYHQMCDFRQHSESASRDDTFLFEGTSSDGLAPKKSAGRIMSWKISTGLL